MKTIIAGGRGYTFTQEDIDWLDEIHRKHKITEVVSGDCSGADLEGQAWAKLNSIPVRKFPADWGMHGKAAGPIRNKEMAEYADMCVLFPGGRGTSSMKYLASMAGLPVYQTSNSGFRWFFKPYESKPTQ